MLAHELRNPLAPIRNALHIIKQPTASAAAAMQQARDMAERQVQHMAHLLDDLLDVSRVSRGRIELRKEPVDMAALVSRTVEAVRAQIEESRHRLTIALSPEPLRVEGDPTRLEQVLTNLLTNACKYTDPGGAITIRADQEDRQVVVRVRDNGNGIAPDMLEKVFDLFVQAERRLDRAQGGVGIGLTLVRQLVTLHGGTVTAHSDGLGHGSEFVVHLPALDADPASPSGTATAAAAATARAPRRVLIVDDNVDAADSLAMLLRFSGHDVRVAYDGPTALLFAQAFAPQLVLLDIGMPQMDGYEVARRLRAEPAFEQTALVALTGWGQEDDRRRAQGAGFNFHLVKPVEPEMLQRLLDSFFDGHG
jgi:CheY-like chemotaxis protein